MSSFQTKNTIFSCEACSTFRNLTHRQTDTQLPFIFYGELDACRDKKEPAAPCMDNQGTCREYRGIQGNIGNTWEYKGIHDNIEI